MAHLKVVVGIEIPESHIREMVPIQATLLLMQILTNVPRKAADNDSNTCVSAILAANPCISSSWLLPSTEPALAVAAI